MDPVGYARDILGVILTPQQEEIARAVHEKPYKVKVDSGHNCGKSFIAAVLVNYWYDVFDPGVVITTAPTKRDVEDILWAEVRLLRQRAKVPLPLDFTGPRAPEMRSGEEHYAKGYTAQKGESFQGRHRPRMLFIFDEDEGVEPIYWTTAKTMFKAELGNAWLCIGNPTTTTSQAYLESTALDSEGNPSWRLIRMSSLDHPNLAAELRGEPPPIPNAVTVAQVNSWAAEWCEPVPDGEPRQDDDFEWPPSEHTGRPGRWWRPGPIGQARIQGRRPSLGVHGVWSESVWEQCLRGPCPPFPLEVLPVIGADMATGKGDDFHAIFARWGAVALHLETSNCMSPAEIFERLRATAAGLAALVNRLRPGGGSPVTPQMIPIRVDDDGVGRSVASFLQRDGYNVTPIGAGTAARNPARYPRRRDEIWFSTADRAKAGGVYLGNLPAADLRRLKQQLLAPRWELNTKGQRVVEKKEDTKEKIGRSPDEADSMNLAYLEGIEFTPPPLAPPPEPRLSLFPSSPGGMPQREQRRERTEERSRGPFRGHRW
jgi:hypothetical protein